MTNYPIDEYKSILKSFGKVCVFSWNKNITNTCRIFYCFEDNKYGVLQYNTDKIIYLQYEKLEDVSEIIIDIRKSIVKFDSIEEAMLYFNQDAITTETLNCDIIEQRMFFAECVYYLFKKYPNLKNKYHWNVGVKINMNEELNEIWDAINSNKLTSAMELISNANEKYPGGHAELVRAGVMLTRKKLIGK